MPVLVADNLKAEEFHAMKSTSAPGEGSMPLGRDLEAARKAYKGGNVNAMIAAHDHKSAAEEKHAGDAGDFIKSLVFGGLDGIITTFAIVCAAIGADLSKKTVIIMGLANLMADAISMGLGDALSEKAEVDFVKREYERETWEMDTNPAGEIREMVELYEEGGVAKEDAELILTTMAKYKTFFVKHMLVLELGLQAPEADDNSPWAKGAVTFGAFILFGSVPLLSYIIAAEAGVEGDLLFGLCILFTLATIFILGAVSGHFSQANIYHTGFFMMCNGGLAAAASYFIGWGLEEIVPDDSA